MEKQTEASNFLATSLLCFCKISFCLFYSLLLHRFCAFWHQNSGVLNRGKTYCDFEHFGATKSAKKKKNELTLLYLALIKKNSYAKLIVLLLMVTRYIGNRVCEPGFRFREFPGFSDFFNFPFPGFSINNSRFCQLGSS